MKMLTIAHRNKKVFWGWIVAACVLTIAPAAIAQNEAATGAETQMVVTAVHRGNAAAQTPAVSLKDVQVQQKGKRVEVKNWQKISGGSNKTQLVLLIDDSLTSKVSLNFQDLRAFLQKLPSSTEVAVGYMQYGSAVMSTGFTTDRVAAAKAIRLPMGIPGGNASPYFCISDLAKKWPSKGQPAASRVVLVITDGIDRYYANGRFDPLDPYVAAAIRDSQQNRMMVSSIYFRDRGGVDAGSGGSFVGQNYLQMLAVGTGGTMYFVGTGNPVTFTPFLDDFSKQLANQYELAFLANGSGLQKVKISTETPRIKLAAPERVIIGQHIP